MKPKNADMLHILYRDQEKPYLYGAILRVDGNNQQWEQRFLISKSQSGKDPVVYGTVRKLLGKISSHVSKLNQFGLESKAMLEANGITPGEDGQLPASGAVVDKVLDAQEDLIEDVLVATAVNIRVLSDIFPQKLKRHKIPVYDYNGDKVDEIELRVLANRLLHHRYFAVSDHYVYDLMSDQKGMTDKLQTGLKINFIEYIAEVQDVVDGLTINDLVGKLRGMTKQLSASSSITDIVFLMQNLYGLGQSMLGGETTIERGPLKTILDKVAKAQAKRLHPENPPHGTEVNIVTTFRTPTFKLEPDLNVKQIRVNVTVNEIQETLVMGYEEFFKEISKTSGSMRIAP